MGSKQEAQDRIRQMAERLSEIDGTFSWDHQERVVLNYIEQQEARIAELEQRPAVPEGFRIFRSPHEGDTDIHLAMKLGDEGYLMSSWLSEGGRDDDDTVGRLAYRLADALLSAQPTEQRPAPAVQGEPVALDDYDPGLINDHGGGDVGWWQDYIRSEVGRANDHWRAQVDVLPTQAAPLRYTSDGALAECPCCGSLDVGGAHDTVSCYGCGLTVTKPAPLQNAHDAWNRRAGKSHPAPAQQPAVPEGWHIARTEDGRIIVQNIDHEWRVTARDSQSDVTESALYHLVDALLSAQPTKQLSVAFDEDVALSLAERMFFTEVDEKLAADVSQYARRLYDLYTAPQPAEQHPDAAAVDRFADAMKAKLARKRAEGRSGWETASASYLSALLHEHVIKGDPVDVANLAMMLHQKEQGIEPVEQQPAPDVAGLVDALVEALELASKTLTMACLEGEVTRRIDAALAAHRKQGGEA